MELLPYIQTYDWGSVGTGSLVANLFKNVNPRFIIDPNRTYAELWIGTHVNGPSMVKSANKPLLDVIKENPKYLGDTVKNKFGVTLPFLLKVLSVEKALSIQVHPSKAHAEQLHALQPTIYKDPNHKPELAIALTEFEALCGFRPYSQIATFLKEIPELRGLIGSEQVDAFIHDQNEVNMKACFSALMHCGIDKIERQLELVIARFGRLNETDRTNHLANLLEILHVQFPGDVGCFVIYFLNYIRLQPQEAMYLGANVPHAYIKGDCIECMACSDNVIRAGLTPKFKDVNTLCAMLNYTGEPPSAKMFQPISENKFTVLFKPPVPDFAVARIKVPEGAPELQLLTRTSGSILLIIKGSAIDENRSMFPGTSIFIPANRKTKLHRVSKDFLAFQAVANL